MYLTDISPDMEFTVDMNSATISQCQKCLFKQQGRILSVDKKSVGKTNGQKWHLSQIVFVNLQWNQYSKEKNN